MIGITLTAEQIRTAPPLVRQWIEQRTVASLGMTPQAPAIAVLWQQVVANQRPSNGNAERSISAA
jgi:hypothetical protein